MASPSSSTNNGTVPPSSSVATPSSEQEAASNQQHQTDDERIVYLNGEFVPQSKATISIFDRGFLFGEGIYEVTAVLNGKLMDASLHLERLRRSCTELDNMPSDTWSNEEILGIQEQLIRLNAVEEGCVYLQITRGSTGDRDFNGFDPSTATSSSTGSNGDDNSSATATMQPTLVIFTQRKNLRENPKATTTGMSVISLPDLRWGRRDIKTTQLVAAVMAKSQARRMGADDAWFVDDDGYITEGSSANVFWIVDRHRTTTTRQGEGEGQENNNKEDEEIVVVTRALSTQLLPGITRRAVLDRCLSRLQMDLVERKFKVQEVIQHAKEAFMTSSTSFVMPVVSVDNQPIGNGKVGPMVQKLRELYIQVMEESSSAGGTSTS